MILGIIIGLLISVILLIGQALLYKRGIDIQKPLIKLSKRRAALINPKKENKINKIFKEL